MPGYKTPRGILGVGSGTAQLLARWTDANTLGVSLLQDDATNVWLNSDTAYFGLGDTPDVLLYRGAANVLAQRNGPTAQALHIYNTFTDASNYERVNLRWSGNEFSIEAQSAGTGTVREVSIGSSGQVKWRFDIAPTIFYPESTNAVDIGKAANRIRQIFAGTSGIDSTGDVVIAMGTGSGTAKAPGVANVNTTAVGNVTVGEDDLITYSLPANSLSANGKGVKIKVWGTTVNNVNAKTIKLYFGTQIILTTSLAVSLAGFWYAEAIVIRSGASTQDIIANLNTNTATVAVVDQEITAGTQTDTAAITIKCTGEAVDTNDIVQEGQLVEFLN